MVNSTQRMLYQTFPSVAASHWLRPRENGEVIGSVAPQNTLPACCSWFVTGLAFIAVMLSWSGNPAIAGDRSVASTGIAKPVTNPVTNRGSVVGNALPASTPIEYNALTRVVKLNGDNTANYAAVKLDTLNTANPADDQVVVNIVVGGQAYFQKFAPAAVLEVYFYGYGGDDTFYNMTSILSRADGGDGNDSLSGGQGQDFLYGGNGNDNIYAGYGNDVVYGGNGNDTISGGDGSDILNGDAGDDTITDYAFSYFDINIINGGSGNDLIYGYGAASVVEISGGSGNDMIYAFGVATVYGNEGDDIIFGSNGGDEIHGQAGNDDIYAGGGNDLVFGGDGHDWLEGGAGHDSLFGQNGNDYLRGDDGNDYLYGGNDDDTLDGGANDDGIFGGDGSDYLLGRAGNDTLSGGYSRYDMQTGVAYFTEDVSDWNYDDLYGGSGRDQILIGDKKFFGYWLDEVYDATPEDIVIEHGWLGFNLQPPYPRWGHLLGNQ